MTRRELVLLADDETLSREFLQEAMQSFGLEVRSRLLGLFEELKTKQAKDALLAIAEKANHDRLKGMAKQTLQANFKGK